MTEYQGIKIHFYRRTINYNNETTEAETNSPGDYIIWGYFDWAQIEINEFSLSDYYNNYKKETNKRNLNKDYEKQSLFGYTPINDLNNKNTKKIISDAQSPLIVVSEIKINKPTQECLEDSYRLISKALEEKNRFHFNIFYSLGHSDFIIIFTAPSYLPILECLQEIKTEEKYNVDSVYSLHGISKDYIRDWLDSQCTRLSIFISLKGSLPLVKLEKEINKRIELINDKKSHNKNNSKPKFRVLPIFGKYDAEVIFDGFENVQDVLSFVNRSNNAIFSSNNDFFKNHINYTRTRWFYNCFSGQENNQNPQEYHSDNLEISKLQNNLPSNINTKMIDLQGLIEILLKIPDKRICNALEISLFELINHYFQIESNGVISPELTEQIGNILYSFLTVILNNIGLQENEIQTYLTNPSLKIDGNLKDVQEDSLERGIFQISELLQDWVQVNRTVLEGPVHNIHYINSSAKVYICYYRIVEKVEEIINNWNVNSGTMINYCTTIHHSDKLKSWLLFPDTSNKNRLVIISLNRDAFFSPRKCLPFLLHEIGLYISPYSSERSNLYLQSIYHDLAKWIVYNIVLGEENEYIQDIINKSSNGSLYFSKIIKLIAKKINDEFVIMQQPNIDPKFDTITFEQLKNLTEKKLKLFGSFLPPEVEISFDKIYEWMVETDKTKPDDNLRYFNNLEQVLNSVEKNIKKGNDIDIFTSFFLENFKQLSDTSNGKDLWDELLKSYHNRIDHLMVFSKELAEVILNNLSDVFLVELQENITGNEQKKALAMYFAKNMVNENSTNNLENIKKRIFDLITSNDIAWKADLYYRLFIETTADLFMIKILGFNSSDYEKQFFLNSNSNTNGEQSVNTEISDDLPATTLHAQEIRKQVILNNWNKIINRKEKRVYSTNNYFIEGVHRNNVVDYLKIVSKSLDVFCNEEEIIFLKRNFTSLKNDDKAKDELIKNEINFIQNYSYLSEDKNG